MSIVLKGECAGLYQADTTSRTAKRTFLYYCTEGEDIRNILNRPDLPEIGDAHPKVPLCFCSNIRIIPETEGLKTLFRVECTYTDRISLFQTNSISAGQAFNVSVRPQESVIPFDMAYSGSDGTNTKDVPVQTTVGSPIFATTCIVSAILRFSFLARSFNPEWVVEFTDTLNVSPMLVCGIPIDAGHGLIRNLTAQCRSKVLADNIQVDVEIELSHNGFYRTFANRSIWCIDSRGKRSRIYTGVEKNTGNTLYGSYYDLKDLCDPDCPIQPVDEEIWLMQNGTIDPNGGTSGENSSPYFLRFREKRYAAWNCLSLPSKADW